MKIGTPITTFQRRYILPFLAVLMATVSVLVWVILKQQANLLDNELQKKGRIIVEELSEMSNINILLDDIESQNTSELVESDEDISNAAVFGADGSLISSHQENFNFMQLYLRLD